MRRAKPLSVKVKGLARGLVTRLPGESADMLPQSEAIITLSTRRAASFASNVRYEDGVVCAAPGYQTIELSTSLLSGFVAQWNLDEIEGDRADSSGNGHTLTHVPGFDSLTGLVLSVTFEAGIFDNAALFNSMAFQAVVDDSFTADARLSTGYISPLPTRFIGVDKFTLDESLSSQSFYNPRMGASKDGFFTDAKLSSGTYTQTIIGPDSQSIQDKFTTDAKLSSGSYVSVVVSTPAPHDKFFTDASLASGVYFNSAVPNNAPQDKFTEDAKLGSGSLVQVVFNPVTHQDKLLLTSTLGSGSYS